MSLFNAFLPKDPGGQHVGFLLNSLRVSVALTSDTTAKNLPKDDSKDHIVQFKGEGREGSADLLCSKVRGGSGVLTCCTARLGEGVEC